MDNRNLILELNAKNEIIRVARGRQNAIAKLTDDNKTLLWKDANLRDIYRTSVEAFLSAEGITVDTVLLEGQKPDVVPANAPQPPPLHKMQGELTPKYLEWLMRWKPIAFQNLMGVELRPLGKEEKYSDVPSENWLRADVIRTDTRATEDSAGGQYLSTRFKIKDQIIAKRASHLTFTKKEIFRGDTAAEQAEPYDDPHSPEKLHQLDKQGKVEIVHKKIAAASAGSNY